MSRPKNFRNQFVLFLLVQLIGFSSVAGGMVAPRCSDIFLDRSFEFETPALTPLESTMNQLEVRLLKVSHLLRMMSLQTQRQANKMMNGLRKIVSDFVRTGEISDQKMAKLMDLTTKLEKLENQLMDAERARQIDPFELGRYLFTAEPILKGVEYRADLPGLGQVKIQFSKEVAEAFSRRGVFREMLFPSIFNGLVSKQGESGLKSLGHGSGFFRVVGEVEYHLFEVKKVGTEARVIIVHSSEGALHFYKIISNHNRVEYINKEGYLSSFLQGHGEN